MEEQRPERRCDCETCQKIRVARFMMKEGGAEGRARGFNFVVGQMCIMEEDGSRTFLGERRDCSCDACRAVDLARIMLDRGVGTREQWCHFVLGGEEEEKKEDKEGEGGSSSSTGSGAGRAGDEETTARNSSVGEKEEKGEQEEEAGRRAGEKRAANETHK